MARLFRTVRAEPLAQALEADGEALDSRPAARNQLSCLDAALAENNLSKGERLVLTALRQFLVEQWIPHLDIAYKRIRHLDRMYLIFERLDIWMTGACWLIKRGLPGAIFLGSLAYGFGHYGSRLGLW